MKAFLQVLIALAACGRLVYLTMEMSPYDFLSVMICVSVIIYMARKDAIYGYKRKIGELP